MKNTDLQIDENYDLRTDPVAHDLHVGDVTLQNQALILKAQPGEWKEHPIVGVGIEGIVNDNDTQHWRRLVREQLQRDGMRVRSVVIDTVNQNIEIDAEYENN